VPNVSCFLLQPSTRARAYARRYSRGDAPCPSGRTYHEALRFVGECGAGEASAAIVGVAAAVRSGLTFPTKCQRCTYVFDDLDERQRFVAQLWSGPLGLELELRQAPAGAMWFAPWLAPALVGPDGRTLVVRLPGGLSWFVDGRAKNCTRPDDAHHRCWVRVGEPPDVTVSKGTDPAATCSAGGGSIEVPGWHGFLRRGVLEPC
jgi:hypothetical protein